MNLYMEVNINYLSYKKDYSCRWCPRTDSNRGPIDYKSTFIIKMNNIYQRLSKPCLI